LKGPHTGALVAGFVAVLVLMLGLTVFTLYSVERSQQALRQVIQQHLEQQLLISRMYHIVRERSLSMFAMLIMDDPMEREDEFMRFHELAGEFIDLRERLQRTPLPPATRKQLDEALALIRTTQPLQQGIVHDIVDEQVTEDTYRRIQQDLPLETRLLDGFGRLLAAHGEATQAAQLRANEASRHTLRVVAYTTALVLLAGILIAWRVRRRTAAMQEELAREKEQAEVTLRSMAEGVLTLDAEGRVRYMNPAAEEATGWTLDQARGRPLQSVYATVDRHHRHPLEHPAAGGDLDGVVQPLERDRLLVGRSGRVLSVEDTAAPLEGGRGSVLVFRDVTESRQLADTLTWQATHDALTGLANRYEFETLLRQLVQHARAQGKHHALLYLDLDQFKLVNDTCGHKAGDAMLKQLAGLLDGCIRDSDTLARLGGDEFGVLLEGCPLAKAEQIGGELLEALRTFRFHWQDKVFTIGASIGVAAIEPDGPDADAVLAAADAACYIAKDKGRNGLWVHHRNDAEVSKRRGQMQWVNRIHEAIEADRLCLYRQRILPLHAGAEDGVARYELLLRMCVGEEIVSPQRFIPAAERYDLMPLVDRWVIRRACRWLAARPRGQALEIAVNISSQSLNQRPFLNDVIDAINGSGTDPASLCLEVTETAAVSHWTNALRFIETLSGMGVRFALDDFGSGMSSFGYLKNLPVHYIKIDGGFIRGLVDDPVDQVTVSAIQQVGRELGKMTIAERVEDEACLDRLRALGVDFGQGYHLHHPEPLPAPRQGVALADRPPARGSGKLAGDATLSRRETDA